VSEGGREGGRERDTGMRGSVPKPKRWERFMTSYGARKSVLRPHSLCLKASYLSRRGGRGSRRHTVLVSREPAPLR
jgi:hypothetical protein